MSADDDDDTIGPDERRAAELVGQQICARCGCWLPLELGNRFECDYPYGHPPPGSRLAAEVRATALRRERVWAVVLAVVSFVIVLVFAVWICNALFGSPAAPVRASPVSGAS